MRRLMSLHFSLVVCYYDNKDPFDARRPFYLQISLLNVITMQAGVCACVCVLYIEKSLFLSCHFSNHEEFTRFMLSHTAAPLLVFFFFFNCYFSLTYARASVRITALIH